MENLELSSAQTKVLRLQARRSVGRVSERIHYVLLFSRGYSLASIADLYQVDERTVSLWLERYQQGGVEGLDDHPRSGRPSKAGAVARAHLKSCLLTSPAEQGEPFTIWTRRLLRHHLQERLGLTVSLSTLTRLIMWLGFVWTRPKLTLKQSDPEADIRLLEIQKARLQYPEAPHLFADECDVHQLPVVRCQYQPKGQQREIPTPGNNKKQPVFGFLDVKTGEWHYWLTQRKRSKDFLFCLHELEKLYPKGTLLVFVDNCSIHKSKITRRWLANHPRTQLYYLPAYSGHHTNPVEKVWWALKQTCLANHMYPCLEAVQDAIIGFFATFTQQDALRLTSQINKPKEQALKHAA